MQLDISKLREESERETQVVGHAVYGDPTIAESKAKENNIANNEEKESHNS